MTARFRMTPRSTKIAGHRSRTSITKGRPILHDTTRAATAAKSVGEDATSTSASRTCGVPWRTAWSMYQRCPSVFLRKPRFGVAYVRQRTTRSPSTVSTWKARPRYSSGTSPVGWFGKFVTTVTSWPRATHARPSSRSRALGAPSSGQK